MTQELPTFLRANNPIDSSTQSALEENREQRVARLYAFPGGPLIGWLYDECRRRGQELRQLAEALGVTYGYINQLRSGLRLTRHISDDFAVSCARYLGVPPVVVKMVAGRIPMSDFVQPHEPLEEAMDRAMACMLDDPISRHVLPADLSGLSIEAKQGLVSCTSRPPAATCWASASFPNSCDGCSALPPSTTSRPARRCVVTGMCCRSTESVERARTDQLIGAGFGSPLSCVKRVQGY